MGLKFAPLILNSRLGDVERINVVIANPAVYLVSVDSVSHAAVVVKFPGDLYMPEVAHGYGQYPIDKVYAAGQLDKRGGQTLQQTVTNYVGVPVSGYVVGNRNFTDLRSYFLSPDFMLKDQSDLNLWERVSLARAVASVRFDKVTKFDLADQAVTLILADGSKAQSLDENVLDNILTGQFNEETLRDENLRVRVVNSTDVAGLGNKAARMLNNIGVSVVAVDSSPIPLSRCHMEAADKLRSSLTVRRITAIFGCQVETSAVSGRSDVDVVIGQDYADLLAK